MTCSQFERVAGRELSKKWKESIHVEGDGEQGSRSTLLSWLKRHAEVDFGAAVVGKPVWICWLADAEYYQGTVTGFNRSSGKHEIQYSSKLTEELHLPVELASFSVEKPSLQQQQQQLQPIGGPSTSAPLAHHHHRSICSGDLPFSPRAGETNSASIIFTSPLWHQGSGISVTSTAGLHSQRVGGGGGGQRRSKSLARTADDAFIGGSCEIRPPKRTASAPAAVLLAEAAAAALELQKDDEQQQQQQQQREEENGQDQHLGSGGNAPLLPPALIRATATATARGSTQGGTVTPLTPTRAFTSLNQLQQQQHNAALFSFPHDPAGGCGLVMEPTKGVHRSVAIVDFASMGGGGGGGGGTSSSLPMPSLLVPLLPPPPGAGFSSSPEAVAAAVGWMHDVALGLDEDLMTAHAAATTPLLNDNFLPTSSSDGGAVGVGVHSTSPPAVAQFHPSPSSRFQAMVGLFSATTPACLKGIFEAMVRRYAYFSGDAAVQRRKMTDFILATVLEAAASRGALKLAAAATKSATTSGGGGGGGGARSPTEVQSDGSPCVVRMNLSEDRV